MEIIIRDEKMPKNCYECSYLNYCSLNPDFKPTVSKCPLKPLSQHDAEVRKKAFEKVLEYIEYEKDSYIKYPEFFLNSMFTQFYFKKLKVLQQKLNELKGE